MKKKTDEIQDSADGGGKRPSVLIVHDASSGDSCQVEAIQLVLDRYGGLDVLVDFNDIPSSRHKDPLLWYSVAMETADFVAILAPAAQTADTADADAENVSIYRHTFHLALELLANRIGRRAKIQKSGFLHELVVLEIPTGSATGSAGSILPDVCSSLTKFSIPDQFPKLIQHIHHHVNPEEIRRNKNSGCRWTDCFRIQSGSDYHSTLIESYQLIYNHLINQQRSVCNQGDGMHPIIKSGGTGEDSSLLDGTELAEEQEEDVKEEEKVKDLDRVFGSVILSVRDLKRI